MARAAAREARDSVSAGPFAAIQEFPCPGLIRREGAPGKEREKRRRGEPMGRAAATSWAGLTVGVGKRRQCVWRRGGRRAATGGQHRIEACSHDDVVPMPTMWAVRETRREASRRSGFPSREAERRRARAEEAGALARPSRGTEVPRSVIVIAVDGGSLSQKRWPVAVWRLCPGPQDGRLQDRQALASLAGVKNPGMADRVRWRGGLGCVTEPECLREQWPVLPVLLLAVLPGQRFRVSSGSAGSRHKTRCRRSERSSFRGSGLRLTAVQAREHRLENTPYAELRILQAREHRRSVLWPP